MLPDDPAAVPVADPIVLLELADGDTLESDELASEEDVVTAAELGIEVVSVALNDERPSMLVLLSGR